MKRKYIGFSLIELVVSMAVATILLTAAVPAFQDMTRRNRMASQINTLIAALNLARSEAVKRAVTVSACKSSNGTSCGASQWEDGWIVFVNDDDDRPPVVDAGEELLRVFPAISSGYTLRPVNNFTNFVTYLSSGDSNTIGRFVLCHNGALTDARVVFVNATGRILLAPDDDGNRIPEDSSGTDITTCTP